MLLVTCKIGAEHIWISPDDANRDPHSRLDENGCTHCLDGHGLDTHCGESANSCPKDHPGACWAGPASGERPNGCTVCRPLSIEIPPSSVSMSGVSN